METATVTPTPTATVQHVNKASSDELLSKFAELDSPDHPSKKSSRLLKRQKRSAQSLSLTATRRESSEFTGTLVVERKSLLPPVVSARRSSGATALVRQSRAAQFRSRNFRNRSFFRTIEKTWRRTIDGASKVFMEKQYNRHKRLLSDTI
ncbi:hypothetical protein L2E82_00898 [Cichorium intybus]|uniref:Uncharacterized protein n=1 Tax=Cichorium intybus TaxID=13427 RepID=A0ACB9GYX7_CICIN|nr:hypothetical protein L2E82_51106 [Cichorium intybus]KAI3788180.1 hypothetical protein L2E82_00898 [Cichorium intybus]